MMAFLSFILGVMLGGIVSFFATTVLAAKIIDREYVLKKYIKKEDKK